MAENLGALTYDVDADTSKFIKGMREVDSATQKMIDEFEKADKSVRRFRAQQESLGRTLTENGKVIDKNGKIVLNATFRYEDLNSKLEQTRLKLDPLARGVKAANDSFGNLGRRSGQAGIQIQQLVGQIQGGQNAFVAISQQAADLGIVLGAPLAGVIVSLGAVVAGSLLPSLFDAKDATKDLEEATEALNEVFEISGQTIEGLSQKIIDLAKVNEQAARAELVSAWLRAEQAIVSVNDAIDDTVDNLNTSLTNAFRSINEEGERFRGVTRIYRDLSDELGITTAEARELVSVINQQQVNPSIETTAALGDTVADLAVKYKTANPALIAFSDGILKNTNQARLLSQASREAANAVGNLDQAVSETLINRQRGRGREEIEGPSRRLFEQQQRERERNAILVSQQLETETESIARKFRERNQIILDITKEGDAERLELLKRNGELVINQLSEISAREEAIQRQNFSNNVTAFGQAAQNLANIAEQGGRESFVAYKRLAQASAIISAAQSVLLTLSDTSIPSTGARVALATSIGGLAGAQVTAIENQQYSGRALGGPVMSGRPVRVGEAGPEIFRDRNRSILIPGENGEILPMGSGNGQPNVTIISTGTPQTATSVSMDESGIRIMIRDEISASENRINNSLSTGRGPAANSLQQGFNIDRRLSGRG